MPAKVAIGIGNYVLNEKHFGSELTNYISLRIFNRGLALEHLGKNSLRLLKYFNRTTQKIIIIDLAYREQSSDMVESFSFTHSLDQQAKLCLFGHEADLINLINLGQRLRLPIPEIKIITIESRNETPTSSVKQERIKRITDQIFEELSF